MRRRDVVSGWLTIAIVVLLGASAGGDDPEAEKRVLADIKSGETAGLVDTGAKLYKDGEYPLAAQRFDEALSANPDDEKALLFGGLTELRLDNPEKTYAEWGKFQKNTKNPKLGEEIGKARTILLREVSERAAKEAVANETRLRAGRTNPQLVAVATFKNAGSAEYAPLGKALAAMLIDNLSAIPSIRVLERERVEALEQEAQLEGSGLVEKGTAVRAGKLLRAGRVTAGSHADWTASPTHLKLDALLVDVDSGKVIAEGKSEAFATEFFKLVPEVATAFATKLNVALSQLPPEAQQKVTQQHTQSLDAALAFGRMLDALDHKDVEKALESCKLAEKLDNNFDLMKKKCALIPLSWLSVAGVAATVEPVAFATIGAVGTSYTIPVVAGLVAAGVAGGTYAAVSGGGGGGGGGNGGSGGNNSPQLNGVGDRTVGAGQTAAIDMDCRDPDGSITTITSGALPPGATFDQAAGNPSTGHYRQPTNANQVGQSFSVGFTCTDSGAPQQAVSRSATIRVVAQPQPTPVPEPTPIPCRPNSQSCSSDGQCCSGDCGRTDFSRSNVCCVGLRGGCTQIGDGGSDCCQPTTDASATCSSGRCCLTSGSECSADRDCCSNFCYFGSCQFSSPALTN